MFSHQLDKRECVALRGIAILAIILHNYCHFLRFAVKENEYTFTQTKAREFMDVLMRFDTNIFVHTMSFLGHYGVPIFLFISGFGLVQKYEKNSAPKVSVTRFIGSHYIKLLSLMFLGYIAFMVISYLHPTGYHGYTFSRVIAQLLMYINFLPFPDRIIKPGPYWFFSLMLQLYIIYRLIIYKKSSYIIIILILACWLPQMLNSSLVDGGAERLNRLRYNFIGGVLPFGLGILYARSGIALGKVLRICVVIVSFLIVLFGSLYFWSWLWVPVFVVTGAVATVKLLPQKLLCPMVWLGSISASLFVAHPIVREIVIPMSYHGWVYSGIVVYLILSVLLAYLFRFLNGLFYRRV